MKTILPNAKCQIHCLPMMAEPIGLPELLWQRRNRVRRVFKRRWHYLLRMFSANKAKNLSIERKSAVQAEPNTLTPGDIVRVRSREEIESTLDRWGQLHRCSFMEEMVPYCGTTVRVFKQVKRFLDERDYLLKKCKGIFILEGVFCEGTKDFGPCDRSCFFFWREEWLEKVGEN